MRRKDKKPIRSKKVERVQIRPDQREPVKNAAFHRRILNFLNNAVSTEELIFGRNTTVHAEGGMGHQGNPLHEDNPDMKKMERKRYMTLETARRILDTDRQHEGRRAISLRQPKRRRHPSTLARGPRDAPLDRIRE